MKDKPVRITVVATVETPAELVAALKAAAAASAHVDRSLLCPSCQGRTLDTPAVYRGGGEETHGL